VRDHLEILSGDKRIILRSGFQEVGGEGGVDELDLSQDTGRRRAFVNKELNFRVP
jgi:hypothetical protein